jgi:hypothetical protein
MTSFGFSQSTSFSLFYSPLLFLFGLTQSTNFRPNSLLFFRTLTHFVCSKTAEGLKVSKPALLILGLQARFRFDPALFVRSATARFLKAETLLRRLLTSIGFEMQVFLFSKTSGLLLGLYSRLFLN